MAIVLHSLKLTEFRYIDDSVQWFLTRIDLHYHLQLAGIVRPHDGNCYVQRLNSTQNYDYTLSRVLDFPSVGLVRLKLQENDIIPIFASVAELEDAYTVGLLQKIDCITLFFAEM